MIEELDMRKKNTIGLNESELKNIVKEIHSDEPLA